MILTTPSLAARQRALSLIYTNFTYTRQNTHHVPALLRSRLYTSRAHPVPKPQYSVLDALRNVIEGADGRVQKRSERWEQNRENRAKGLKKKGLEATDEGPYRNQDETISIALNLNLDPRKPNQSLRGQMSLPHGTGRPVRIAVFTLSPSVVASALDEGAVLAGGQNQIDAIKNGELLDQFDRVIATPDIMPILGKSLARILGPRGLMPNPKMGNIADELDVATKIQEQLAGMVNFRTDKAGIIHAPVGKFSFGEQKLKENIKSFLQGIVDVEPELDKKAKKGRIGGKGGKFMLNAHLNASQGQGVKINLKTADPNSPFFMTNGLPS